MGSTFCEILCYIQTKRHLVTLIQGLDRQTGMVYKIYADRWTDKQTDRQTDIT